MMTDANKLAKALLWNDKVVGIYRQQLAVSGQTGQAGRVAQLPELRADPEHGRGHGGPRQGL